MTAQDNTIYTESRVGSRDLAPAVVFRHRTVEWEMTPEQARQFALTVLGTAEAAEHDAAMVKWLIADLGVDLPHAVASLAALRVHRGMS